MKLNLLNLKIYSILLLTVSVTTTYEVVAQANNFQNTFDKVEGVPSSYVNTRKSNFIKNEGKIDSNYQKLISLDSLVVPFLIGRLTDTTKTNIYSLCLNSNISKGDVAFFL